MSQPTEFDAVAFDKYMDELCEKLMEDGPGEHDGVHADDSFCDWDPELSAAVETAPDGRRYIVELKDGRVVRIKELARVAV